MKRKIFWLVAIILWQGLSGCAKVGPDYSKPQTMVPDTWHAAIDHGLTTVGDDRQLLAKWWTILKDPLLDSYIQQAITSNLDLEQARARLLEARAKRDISSAGLFPTLDVSGSVTKSQSSSNSGSGTESTSYSSGFDAGWELDLFGGQQRSVEAAQAELEASQEDLHDVLISLLSEVALNYVEVREYQARLQIANENLKAQQETFQLTKDRYQSGLASELALQQARYLVSATRATIPSLRTGLANAAHLLAVLLGRPPGSLEVELEQIKPLPTLPSSVAVGIPAQILRNRPDIRKAERDLAAQTAEIGVATAELYPSITLTGSLGLEALSAGKLLSSGSTAYSFGPGISWAIFDAGAIRANIDLQSSLQQETFAKYKATVLSALQDVEDALVAYSQEQERYTALSEAVDAAGQATELVEFQFQAGLSNFTEVLDTRRSLLSYQDNLAQSKATMIGNLIRLYKALGGGWTSTLSESNKQSGTNNNG